MRKTDADSSGHTMAQRRGAQALRVGGVVGLALTALVIALVARHGALTERADAGPSGVTLSSSRLGARAAAAATRDSLATPRQIVRPPEPRRASEKEALRVGGVVRRRRRRGNGNGNPRRLESRRRARGGVPE